jgi:hypothetical protein
MLRRPKHSTIEVVAPKKEEEDVVVVIVVEVVKLLKSFKPSVNVTKYHKGVYYLGVKVFNILPSYIKTEFENPRKFKTVLQKFLYENSSILWKNILNF